MQPKKTLIGRRTILQILSHRPVPERAMFLSSMPTTQPLTPVTMTPQFIQSMRDWAQTFGAAVRQRSAVRQQTTMAIAGTLPSFLYHKEVQPGGSASLEPAEPSSRQMRDSKREMKATKKAFLSTIRLAAIKIQKNSYLVIN